MLRYEIDAYIDEGVITRFEPSLSNAIECCSELSAIYNCNTVCVNIDTGDLICEYNNGIKII